MSQDQNPQQPSDSGETEKPSNLDRRDFFVRGFQELFRPLAKIVGDRLERIKVPPEFLPEPEYEWETPPGSSGDPSLDDRILRPPGALQEEHFADRCDRSGQCIAACPVQAIRVYSSEDEQLNDTPHIDPQVQACVVCDDLSCMNACPSGALSVVPKNHIQMGLAGVNFERCLRSTGDDCQICVERCPIGYEAIEIPYYGERVEVKEAGCIGCGLCEMYCPTDPRSIIVRPLAEPRTFPETDGESSNPS